MKSDLIQVFDFVVPFILRDKIIDQQESIEQLIDMLGLWSLKFSDHTCNPVVRKAAARRGISLWTC
jgi:hypothetical protein